MPTLDSVLFDDGKPVKSELEPAYLLAWLNGRLTRDFRNARRDRVAKMQTQRMFGFVIAILAALAGLVVLTQVPDVKPLGYFLFVAALVALGLAVHAINEAAKARASRSNARVLRLAKVHWTGTVLPFDGESSLIIDRTGIFPPQRLSLPFLPDGPHRLRTFQEQLRSFGHEAPIVLSRDGDPEGDPALFGLERDLDALSRRIEQALADVNSIDVTIPALSGTSGFTRAVLAELPHAADDGPVFPLRSDDRNMREALDDLRYALSQDRGDGDDALSSLEDSAQELLDRLENRRAELTSIRRSALQGVLNDALTRLSKNFLLPMVRVCCPECLRNAAAQASTNAPDDPTDPIAPLRHIERPSLYRMYYHVDSGTASSGSSESGMWHCERCHARVRPSDVKYVSSKLREDLLFPVWTSLWMELEQEKNRIVREKEKEMRDRAVQEFEALRNAAQQYTGERRRIDDRLQDQRTLALKARQRIRTMVEAFETAKILRPGEAAALLGKIDARLAEATERQKALIENVEQTEREFLNLPTRVGDERETTITALASYTDLRRPSGLLSAASNLRSPRRASE